MSSDQDTFINGVEILDTSVATSASSGSLMTYGGIAIYSTTNATTTSGSLFTLGGSYVQGNTIIGGITQLLSTTQATNTSTGALQIAGGMSVQNNLYGNFANFTNLQATGATIPNLVTTNISAGTLSLASFNPTNITCQNLYTTNAFTAANQLSTNITTTNILVSTLLNLTSTVQSTSVTTGAFIIGGGIGATGNIFGAKSFFGDASALANNSRPSNLVDTRAAISCWRWVQPNGLNSGNPAIELIAGTSGNAGDGLSNWWDIYLDDSDALAFRRRTNSNNTSSSVYMTINSAGNVGIGPTSAGNLAASSTLTVNGNSSISGTLVVSNTTVSSSPGTGAIVVSGGVGIGGNLSIAGNLTVSGTTVTVNSTNVSIADNILTLNSGPSGTADSGVLFQRYQIANNAGTGDIISDAVSFTGTLQTGTSTSQIVLPSGASAVDGFYVNYWVKITSGTANNNVRQITAYTGATRTAILATVLTATPTANVDTVSLYGNVYAGFYYKESTNQYTLALTATNPGITFTESTLGNLLLSNLTSNLITSSNIIVTNLTVGSISLTNFTTTNLFSTNSSLSNLLAINSNLTNLTSVNTIITNLTNTNALITNASISTLSLTNSNLTNLTSVNALITNLTSTNIRITNSTVVNEIITNLTNTNALITNASISTLSLTNSNLTNLTSVNALITNLTNTNAIITNASISTLSLTNSNLTNLTSVNALITNLTNTNALITNASISTLSLTNSNLTNLTSVNALITNLTAGSLSLTNLNITNATIANSIITTLSSSNVRITTLTTGSIVSTNINTASLTTGSISLTNLVATNVTIQNSLLTNASASNINISNTANIAGAIVTPFLGGTWINMPTSGASGIGVGGPGVSPWLGYVAAGGQWFTNAVAGDLAYRNVGGNLLFGNTPGLSTMAINNEIVTVQSTLESTSDTTGSLVVRGGVGIEKRLNVGATNASTNVSTGALVVSGGGGFNGDLYANNIYSNNVLVSSPLTTQGDLYTYSTTGTALPLGTDGQVLTVDTVQSTGLSWSTINTVWGTGYTYIENLATAGTTSNSYILRTSLTTGNLLSGTYQIEVGYYMFSGTITTQNSEFRVYLNPGATQISTGTLIHQNIDRPSQTTLITPKYDIITTNLTGGTYRLSLIFRNQNNGSTTNISNARLKIFRLV